MLDVPVDAFSLTISQILPGSSFLATFYDDDFLLFLDILTWFGRFCGPGFFFIFSFMQILAIFTLYNAISGKCLKKY